MTVLAVAVGNELSNVIVNVATNLRSESIKLNGGITGTTKGWISYQAYTTQQTCSGFATETVVSVGLCYPASTAGSYLFTATSASPAVISYTSYVSSDCTGNGELNPSAQATSGVCMQSFGAILVYTMGTTAPSPHTVNTAYYQNSFWTDSTCTNPAGYTTRTAQVSQGPACSSSTTVACSPGTGYVNVIDVTLSLASGYVKVDCLAALPTSPPVQEPSGSSGSCFAGSEMLELESGELKSMATAVVGDKVLVASMNGEVKGYSAIVAIPHAANSVEAAFVNLVTASRSVKMTTDHLVLGGSCEAATMSLVSASSLAVGQCIQTVSGPEQLASVSSSTQEGIYTIVTENAGLIVVNGVVASPFAINHVVANAFYSIHRMIYALFPSMLKSSVVMKSIELFGRMAVEVSSV